MFISRFQLISISCFQLISISSLRKKIVDGFEIPLDLVEGPAERILKAVENFTTRDVRLLDILGVDFIYEVEGLNAHESLKLFSFHAFREARSTKDFAILSRDVVAYCDGLPLALEVLGSYLFKRRKQEWQSVLSKLKKILNDEIHKKLKISFEGLRDRMEKDIFLDICCFFIGKDSAYVTEILNGCDLQADIGITVLIPDREKPHKS
ncbi:NB-ARC domain disease resistance protein [Medicago truncatula]|uniref:NB-ARC domain disease resistance protein n=1 Tax=Medicago truncatula TaxID=3880 RepID=G7KDQ8_MEDTR|nr:NB-ARC domain disease resistance protein [Medicago truncatula]